MSVMKTQDVIGQLLASLGSPSEVAQYLRVYADADRPALAVIKVGGPLLDQNLDALVGALVFLREVGVRPVLVHGAGPQLDRALKNAGRTPEFLGEQRVTDAATLEIARRVFHEENLRLVDALSVAGLAARPVVSHVVTAEPAEDTTLGFVGENLRITPAPLESALAAGHIPVLPPLGESPAGQILNVNTDAVTEALARTLRPHKVLFLTQTGGLLDERGEVMSAVNLVEDGDSLLAQPWVNGGMRHKLRRIWRLLEDLGPDASVSITAPENLAKELFTHQGAGTLVRLGERVSLKETLDDSDRQAVRGLMRACFGRDLVADYFDSRPIRGVYVVDNHRGAAVVTDCPGVAPHQRHEPVYLDKFGVTDRAQGAGVGATLWRRLVADHPRILWRSRERNPINGWYLRQADGATRRDGWVVFWRGLSAAHALEMVDTIFSLAPSLVDEATNETGTDAAEAS